EKVLQSSPLLQHAQVIILGIGEKYWERRLKILADQRSKSLRVVTRFDEELAHKIYAASDFILLPSKFEPCGLTQLIAMKYGSIPIVRKTGGLADTVINQISNPDRGTGLVFEKFTAREFSQVLGKSMGLYQQLDQFSAMQSRAMSKDFSW